MSITPKPIVFESDLPGHKPSDRLANQEDNFHNFFFTIDNEYLCGISKSLFGSRSEMERNFRGEEIHDEGW